MRFPFVIVAFTLIVGAALAHAQPTPEVRAREIGARAVAAAEAGDLTAAIALFKEARGVDDRAEYLCNIGYAYQRLGELPRAHLFLSECLVRAGAMDLAAAQGFRSLLDDVEATLRSTGFAPVDVTVTPRGAEVGASTFAADETAPGPRIVWLPAGRHTIGARATGYQDAAEAVDVPTGGGRLAVSIALVPLPAVVADVPIVVVARRASRTPALIGFAAGGVGLAAGVYFHLQALGTRDEIARDHPFASPERDRVESTWRREVTGMYVGYGLGVVAVGVGAYLWWRSGPRGAPLVTPAGRDRVTLTWSF